MCTCGLFNEAPVYCNTLVPWECHKKVCALIFLVCVSRTWRISYGVCVFICYWSHRTHAWNHSNYTHTPQNVCTTKPGCFRRPESCTAQKARPFRSRPAVCVRSSGSGAKNGGEFCSKRWECPFLKGIFTKCSFLMKGSGENQEVSKVNFIDLIWEWGENDFENCRFFLWNFFHVKIAKTIST